MHHLITNYNLGKLYIALPPLPPPPPHPTSLRWAKLRLASQNLLCQFAHIKLALARHLLLAAKERNLKIQEFVNTSDKSNTKPLHLSARSGQLNIMKILLRHEANVNAQRGLSGRCFSALHSVAVCGDLKMCQLLLNYNASVDLKDCDGCTPLHR